MASARAQAPASPPPSLGAQPDHAAETTRRQGKPEGKRRAAFVSGSSDTTARVSKSSLDLAVNNGAGEFPERRRSARLAEKRTAEAPSRVAPPEPFRKSARLEAKPARSFAPAKRAVSKSAASETRGAGTSTKSRVSKQTGEAARRDPLSPLSSNEAARRDENVARGAVNGDGARKRSDPSAPRAHSRRIQGRLATGEDGSAAPRAPAAEPPAARAPDAAPPAQRPHGAEPNARPRARGAEPPTRRARAAEGQAPPAPSVESARAR